MLDKIGFKDFMKSRFTLGLVLLTSVAATALTITQASASSTQLKEGEWIAEFEVSGEKHTSTTCYDREMLSFFEAPQPAGTVVMGVKYTPVELTENGYVQKGTYGNFISIDEVVIHSSTQFELSSRSYFTSSPDDVTTTHHNLNYNGPCKKDDKTGDVSIKDESGEQGTIEFNANEAMDDYRARVAEDALKARAAE
jgi:hypothetical protein